MALHTDTASTRTWDGERLVAERRKGLHRKIITKATPRQRYEIRGQMGRFISASIPVGVGIQTYLRH